MKKPNRRFCAIGAAVLAALLLLLPVVPRRAAATTDAAAGSGLLILMYHGILPDNSRGLGDYVVSISEFESDLRWLAENGYQSVTLRSVIDHVKSGAALPEKPVMITFDDGYYNNYLYAYPLLQTYSYHMVLSPICRWSDFYSEQKTADARYTPCQP